MVFYFDTLLLCIGQPLLCIRYHLNSMSGKLHVLCTVTVNLKTSISKLGRVLFHNNSYIRCPLVFTESSVLLKMVKQLIFVRENAVLNIMLQLYQ